MKLNTPRYHSHWQKPAHSVTSDNVPLYNGRNRNSLVSAKPFSCSAQGGAMTLQPYRLAPNAGSLEVRQGFVSYHRISTYSIWIITHIPAFVKGFKQNHPNILLSILNTSFHLPPHFFLVEITWNLPERSAFRGSPAVLVIT